MSPVQIWFLAKFILLLKAVIILLTIELSGAEGLEPPNGRTKTGSLTTWLRPISKYNLYYYLIYSQILYYI